MKLMIKISHLFCGLLLATPTGCEGQEGIERILQSGYELFFVEDCPDRRPGSVSIRSTAQVAEEVTGAIEITDVSGIHSASLRLTFDPDVVDVSVTEGDFLNHDGNETALQVDDDTPGVLVISISRAGASRGIDAVGSETLLNLTFRHKKAEGRTALSFSDAYLLGSGERAEKIPNVKFCGGTVVVIVRV